MKIINRLLLSCCLVSLINCGGGGSDSATAQSSSATPSSVSSSSSSVAPPSSSSAASSSSTAAVEELYPSYNTNPLPADSTGMSSNAVDIASKISLGWNIGNTLEAIGGETAWGNPMVTNELIQLVKSNGFEAVRIPVSWDQYANQETAEINSAWLDRVKDVVQLCVDNDIYVIVNIHWDGGWLENNVTPNKQAANVAKQKAFWEQIATHLREFDERVMFAGANEPNVDTAEQMDVLLAYHQTFVDAVRATGGRNAYRVLIVQGPATDIEKTHELWSDMPDDTVADRLMAEVHFYTPYNFTLMREDESWGNQFYYWGEGFHSLTDTEHNPTWGEEPFVTELFELMQQQFIAQGIPVILGEFAAMRRDNLTGEALELHLASRAHYLKYVTQEALDKGLIPFYWDSGALNNLGSGIFNRQDNTVFDQQALDGLLQGAGKQ
ncbi:glycoside hydrolase family 5 protein [Cellvibrio sp. PSBB006]|uniref:glycoside hydrolase family 5 protein n=1 Tax=Cellvibrio sp. PSBB006 TaxID=1987723 RepID=UPI001E5B7AE9|nr:glycoside hydrolase family 5 protein [Cellvibrio sp. PSBB006]